MASELPAKLKVPDILPFVRRGHQLEKAKPVIAYWCNYWVVNQILSKGLHNSDAECLAYTTQLMDKLEQAKADSADTLAITDEEAGKSYAREFAFEVFRRADNAMIAEKVTRQTGDTFQAAATFFELLRVWGTLDAEIVSKIKYAKYHALRIAKAIQAGEDPNIPRPSEEVDTLDEELSTIQQDTARTPPVVSSQGQLQPSAEEVSDEDIETHPALPHQMSHQPAQSPLPNSPPLIPTPPNGSHPTSNYYAGTGPGSDVSPLEPESNDIKAGGYFPPVHLEQTQQPSLDPPSIQPDPGPITPSDHPSSPQPPPSASFNYPSAQPPQPLRPTITPNLTHQPPVPSVQPWQAPPQQDQQLHSLGPLYHSAVASQTPGRAIATASKTDSSQQRQTESYNSSDDAVMLAQKHARWAISALNFEDVNTAVKELREALNALGAN